MDKVEYRKRREDGLRGQGDYPVTSKLLTTKGVSHRPKGVARRMVVRSAKPDLPTQDPTQTNHQRHLQRRATHE